MTQDEMATIYAEQLTQMCNRARAWVSKNKGRNPRIQWNYPPKAATTSTARVAMSQHFVSANKGGMDLIKFIIAPYGDRYEPTLLMLRAAVESVCPKE